MSPNIAEGMTPDALRDLLVAWANINSGTGHLAGLERMRTALAAEFGQLPGAQVDVVALAGDARGLRVAVRPAAEIQLLLSGHFDTVYDAGHPFQCCTLIDERTLRGPGVADMKGGLVVLLAALRAFEQSSGARERIGYEILLTPDEETGSVASRPVLEAAARSGRFAFALVFEPARANGDLVRSRKGTGIFTLTCHGRAAHAGRDPSAGRNAILALAACLPEVDALGERLPGVMVNVGRIRGGGAVNIVPDLASADVNVRITTAADAAAVLDAWREITGRVNAQEGFRMDITGGFNRPPKEVTPFEERLFAAWQACGRDVGAAFSWQHVGGGSDGNLLSAAGLANLDGLGPVGDHLHSPQECIHLPSLAERAHVAARFLCRFAAREIKLA